MLFVRWVVLPILYATSILPVLLLSWFVVVPLTETVLGCPACDIGGLLGILILGGPTFGLLSLSLTRFEQLRNPGVLDHMRHSLLLYLSLSTLVAAQLIVNEELVTPGLAYAFGLVLFLITSYAVLVDLLIVFTVRQRMGRNSL